MNKLIVDFEATCSDSDEFPRNEMEIIEIGAVLMDSTCTVELARYHTCIKPVKNPTLTSFCLGLTGITQKDVNLSDTFDEVIPNFLKWIRSHGEYTFYSWGDFDKNILNRQCREYGLKVSDVIDNHVNAKVLFAQHNQIKPKGVGAALRYKNMRFEGQPHRALDDAINIARLIGTIKEK